MQYSEGIKYLTAIRKLIGESEEARVTQRQPNSGSLPINRKSGMLRLVMRGPYWNKADVMMRSPQGQQALSEGWGYDLFTSVLSYGTTQHPDFVERLPSYAKDDRKFFERVALADRSPVRDAVLAIRQQEEKMEVLLKGRYLDNEGPKSNLRAIESFQVPGQPGWKQADLAMRSKTGQQALREGWGRQLFDVVLRFGPIAADYDPATQLHWVTATEKKLFHRIALTPSTPLRDGMLAIWEKIKALDTLLNKQYLQPITYRKPHRLRQARQASEDFHR